MEATNLAAFLKFGKAKNQKIVLSLQKKSWVAKKLEGPGAKLGCLCPPARA